MKRTLRNNAGWIVCFILLAAVYIMATFVTPVYAVNSGSMEPTLPVGTRVVTIPDDTLEKRDVITFRNEGEVITHTFIGYAEDGSLRTVGDANLSEDNFLEPVMPEDVIGRVVWNTQVFVPEFWLTPRGICAGIAIAALGYIFFSREKKQSVDDTTHEKDRASDPVQLSQ